MSADLTHVWVHVEIIVDLSECSESVRDFFLFRVMFSQLCTYTYIPKSKDQSPTTFSNVQDLLSISR